jgi:uncharacterized membrane protein
VDTGGKRTTVGLFTQMRLLMERSFKNVIREPNVLRAGLIQIVVIALLMGLIFLRRGYTQSCTFSHKLFPLNQSFGLIK